MSRKTSQLTKFAEFDIADLDSATKSITQNPGNLGGKWIALRVDGSVAGIDSAEFEAFDEALAEHGADNVDVVLIVDSRESSEVLAAWEAAKTDAPASVLAKLPDVDGKACRYVALTGKQVADSLPTKDSDEDQLSDKDRKALRTGITNFVRENAEDVRGARAEIQAAVTEQSAAKAFSGSLALDSATDRLQVTCESSLEDVVAEIDLSSDPTGTPDNPVVVEKLQTERDSALSEFAAASSKGGFGKLLAKSKIKNAGDQLLAATDSLVGARASELIEALIIKAEPLLVRARTDAQVREFDRAIADLSKATDAAATNLTQALGIDSGAIERPWTSGTPQPRHYVVAEAQVLDQLDLSIDATKVPTQDFEGVYVLQAQHALSAAALTANLTT